MIRRPWLDGVPGVFLATEPCQPGACYPRGRAPQPTWLLTSPPSIATFRQVCVVRGYKLAFWKRSNRQAAYRQRHSPGLGGRLGCFPDWRLLKPFQPGGSQGKRPGRELLRPLFVAPVRQSCYVFATQPPDRGRQYAAGRLWRTRKAACKSAYSDMSRQSAAGAVDCLKHRRAKPMRVRVPPPALASLSLWQTAPWPAAPRPCQPGGCRSC